MLMPDTWFLPSFWGDIALHRIDEHRTRLTYERLTPEEVQALTRLRRRALKRPVMFGQSWCDASEFPVVVPEGKGTVDLRASIVDVQKVLASALKPGRDLLSVVRFHSGRMEEVGSYREAAPRPLDELPPPPVSPPAPALPAAAQEASEKPDAAKPPQRGAVATTVAVPVRGCPAPDFEKAEMRAFGVLRNFLTPDQQQDVQRRGAFVAVGADTGHRYMLTNRHAFQLGRGRRTLHDLDERRDYCVHDWEVPAWEELLAIFCCLSVPGRERMLREIPDVG